MKQQQSKKLNIMKKAVKVLTNVLARMGRNEMLMNGYQA